MIPDLSIISLYLSCMSQLTISFNEDRLYYTLYTIEQWNAMSVVLFTRPLLSFAL